MAPAPLMSVLVGDHADPAARTQRVQRLTEQTWAEVEVVLSGERSTSCGWAAARNAAAGRARGAFLCFIEAGEELDPTYLEKALLLLHHRPRAAYVVAHRQAGPPDHPTWSTPQPYDVPVLLERPAFPGCAVMRRAFFDGLHGYDEAAPNRVAAEWDFWLRAGRKKQFGHLLDEPLVIVRTVIPEHDPEAEAWVRRRHADLFTPRRRKRLRLEAEEHHAGVAGRPALCARRVAHVPRPLRRTALKFHLAGLANPDHWRQAPLACLLRLVPVVARRRLNRWVGRRVVTEDTRYAPPEPVWPTGPWTAHPARAGDARPPVLVVLSWLPMGGIETLLLHLFQALADEFRFIVMTTQPYPNTLHAFFAEVARVYDLAHLFDAESGRRAFMQETVRREGITRLLIINSMAGFKLLPELKAAGLSVRALTSLHGWNKVFDYLGIADTYAAYLDRIICVSEPVRAEYEGRYGRQPRLQVIRNVIDYPRLQQQERARTLVPELTRRVPGQRNLVFLGRYNPDKQPHLFLSVAEWMMRRPEAGTLRFFLFGEGQERAALEERARRLNQQAGYALVTVGHRQENVAAVYAQADLCLNCSPHEGFGLTPLEAIYFGVPVVAFDLDVFRLYLPPEHFYPVPSGEPATAEAFVPPLLDALRRLPAPEEKIRMRAWVQRQFPAEAFYQGYREALRESQAAQK